MHSWDQKAGICRGEKGRDSPVGSFWWPLGTAGPTSPHHTLQSAPAQHWVTRGCTSFESSSHRETSCQASKLGPLQTPNPVPGGSDLPPSEGELARGSGQGGLVPAGVPVSGSELVLSTAPAPHCRLQGQEPACSLGSRRGHAPAPAQTGENPGGVAQRGGPGQAHRPSGSSPSR